MAVNDLNLFFFSAFITLTTVSEYRPLQLNTVILGYLWQNSDSNWWERKVSTAAEENVCEVSSFPNNPTVYTHFVILKTRSSKSFLLWKSVHLAFLRGLTLLYLTDQWKMMTIIYLFIYLNARALYYSFQVIIVEKSILWGDTIPSLWNVYKYWPMISKILQDSKRGIILFITLKINSTVCHLQGRMLKMYCTL